LLTPTYHLLDLTPAGRGEWDPSGDVAWRDRHRRCTG
jgi:predicted dithiol-disulfide oxidoreductase (DUF899 family)